LNMDNNKSLKWHYPSEGRFDPTRYSVEEEVKGRRSATGRASRRSKSLQRSISDGVERGIQPENEDEEQ
ncbi:hypothetical protein PIB30_043539, partial [Stylosanthes scabra]|nr:hypothetical protein [Stylosanthes scabra]